MIDILVPVLGRPENAQPLVDSITAATNTPHRVLFLCSPCDPIQVEACQVTGQEVIVCDWEAGPGDYARKINAGYRETDSEWVFQAADDLRFELGWETAALGCAERAGVRVVGTNDLHNPGVKKKTHATHILFARSYIEEHGGTHDGTGDVLCELYDHQFVDTEFVEMAKRRKEWVFCSESVVEHLHPYWELAEYGPTYTKALAKGREDQALFNRRLRRFPKVRYTRAR